MARCTSSRDGGALESKGGWAALLGSSGTGWDVPLCVGAPQPLVCAQEKFSCLSEQVFPVVTALAGSVSTSVGSLVLQ